jgi:glucose/arabinose dehydrogenase
MAFHPRFGEGENRRVFLSYISQNQDSIVEEYVLEQEALVVVPNTRMVEDPQPHPNHNGGMVAFGADGYLYISIGDGGAQYDGDGNAQNRGNPLGKILRINVDDIDNPPAGNLSGEGDDSRILHWGLRNPWRFSFDLVTNDLYVADVGQDSWEEVTILSNPASSSNFGWPALEGTHPCDQCQNNKPPISDDMLRPQIEYSHAEGRSITGGYVYRSTRIPGLAGVYFYADYESQRVWTAKFDGGSVCDNVEVSEDLDPEGVLTSVSSFGQDASGEVYITNIGDGFVYRIDPE